MRHTIAVLVFACAFAAGCTDKGSMTEPTTANGAKITVSTAKIKFSFHRALHSAPPAFSVTVSGSEGPQNLVDRLPTIGFINVPAGETWDGSCMRGVDWGTNALGASDQSCNPFSYGTVDHYQMDDIPSNGQPDVTFEWIPGGQTTLVVDPRDPSKRIAMLKPGARKLPVWPNQQNVNIQTDVAVQTSFTGPDERNLIHVHMNRTPY